MTESLVTNEEKLVLINDRIKTLQYFLYEVELGLAEENAGSSPSPDKISDLNNQMADLESKIDAMKAKKAIIV
jgi:hypothetical protein